MKTYAVILASGKGERFGTEIPKQFLKLSGKTVLEHAVDIFEKHPKIDEIIIVTLKEYVKKVEEFILKNKWKKISKILIGGNTRQESSYIALSSIEDKEAKILIHDAVRPLLPSYIIDKVVDALNNYDAVDVAIPSTDTIIRINEKKLIEDIPERKYFWRGQTPQGFKLSVIREAHELARKENFTKVTDDCGLVLYYKLTPIYVVKGHETNIKITYPIDIYIADKLFQLRTLNLLDINLNKNKLKNKVGIIFGASQGIGKAIYDLSKSLGMKIYGFSRASGCDITKIEQVKNSLESVYKKEKRIDFIIVTAGILIKKPLINQSYEEIQEQININYLGSINVAKESYKYLKESKGHLILFTSSSYTRGRAFYSIYSSTKAAIVNLAQALAEEWSVDNIKVNVICPERTATFMRFKNFGKEPLNTLLKPETVAKETLKLLLTNVTGQVIDVKLQKN